MFAELGLSLEDRENASWLESDYNDPRVQILSDTEICDLVNTDNEDEEQNQMTSAVSNSDAASIHCF